MGMKVHRKDRARRQIIGVAIERDASHTGALAVEAALREGLAVFLVVPRETFVVGRRRAASLAGLDQKFALVKMVLLISVFKTAGFWSLADQGKIGVAELIVAYHVRAGPDLAREADVGHIFFFGGLIGLLDVGDRCSRTGCIGLEVIAEGELAAFLLREGKGDSRFLEEAAEELVVALGILDFEFELGILSAIDLPYFWYGPFREKRVDDIGNGYVLEDAVVAALGEAPQLGNDSKEVRGQAFLARSRLEGVELLGIDNNAAPGAFAEVENILVAGNGVEGRRLVQDGGEIKAGIGGVRPNGSEGEGGDALVNREAVGEEGACCR